MFMDAGLDMYVPIFQINRRSLFSESLLASYIDIEQGFVSFVAYLHNLEWYTPPKQQ